MSLKAWEDICSRCTLCCHEKAYDEEAVYLDPERSCEFLDEEKGLCRVYENRFHECSRCMKISLFKAMFYPALPPTCAYVQWAEKHHLRFCRRRELVLVSLDEDKGSY